MRVLLIYEDLPTGLRAKEAADTLAHACETHFAISAWRSNLLTDPGLAPLAQEEAREARLIMLGVHSEVPDALRVWIGSWLDEPHATQRAVVTMFDDSADDSPDSEVTYTEPRPRAGTVECQYAAAL